MVSPGKRAMCPQEGVGGAVLCVCLLDGVGLRVVHAVRVLTQLLSGVLSSLVRGVL